MSFQPNGDGRKYERFEILDYAMVSCPKQKEPFRSVIVDIGLGGLQLRSKDQLPVGDTCSIQIGQTDGEPIQIRGEVRYSRVTDETGLYCSGFKFMPASHDERSAIAQYVHSVFMRQGEVLARTELKAS